MSNQTESEKDMEAVELIIKIDLEKQELESAIEILANRWVSLNAKEFPSLTSKECLGIMSVIEDCIGKDRCLLQWNRSERKKKIINKLLISES